MKPADTLKRNRVDKGTAVLLVCVYLFGTFVSSILHPLHHSQENHFCHSTKNVNGHSSREDKNSNPKSSSTNCVLCHFGVSYETIVDFQNDKIVVNTGKSIFREYTHPQYAYTFFTFTPSRAPPVQLS